MKRFKVLFLTFLLGAIVVCVWPYLPRIQLDPPGAVTRSIGLALKQQAAAEITTDFEVRVSQLAPAGRMVTAAVHETLSIRKQDPSWWFGSLDVRVDVPIRVLYAVDLASLKPGDITWNEQRRVMTLLVPDIAVESIEFDCRDSRSTFEHIGWWRSESGEGKDLARAAEDEILTSARELAKQPALFEKARLVSVPSLKTQLEKILRAVAGPDAIVEILIRQQQP